MGRLFEQVTSALEYGQGPEWVLFGEEMRTDQEAEWMHDTFTWVLYAFLRVSLKIIVLESHSVEMYFISQI